MRQSKDKGKTVKAHVGARQVSDVSLGGRRAADTSACDRPRLGEWKDNTDAAVDAKHPRAGLGWVAQDHFGNAMFGGSKMIRSGIEVELAEALALKEAVLSALAYNLDWVVFEGDAMELIQSLQGRRRRAGEVQLIIDDILFLCRTFDDVSFSFCFRSSNSVAHILARWAKEGNADFVWFEVPPIWVSDVLLADLTSF